MTTKAPVVLIHGMWSTPETLDELKLLFENEGHEVSAPCLPWHLPRNQMDETAQANLAASTVQDYVAAIGAHLENLDQPPILVGHSMGGILAQLVAARFPVERLILLSTAPAAGMNGWSWSVVKTFGRNLFLFPLWKHVTKLRLDNVRYGIANSQTPAIQTEIIQNCTYESGTVAWQLGMWFLFRNPPSRVDYHKISCPVLIIGGNQDRITPIAVQRKTAARYAGRCTLHELDGACHWTIGGSYLPQIRQHIVDWLGSMTVAKAA